MKRNSTVWIAFVLALMKHLPSADSIRCFECENCPTIGEDEIDYIKECSLSLETFSTQEPETGTVTTDKSSTRNEGMSSSSEAYQSLTSSSTSVGLGTNSTNSSSTLSSTLSTLTSVNKTETTQKLQSGSSEAPSTTTTTKSSVMSTTLKQKVTNSWSIFPNSIEENELNNLKPEDPIDEYFIWKARQANEVCYVLKLKYDGNDITKRGCGLRGPNGDQTCQILVKGEANAECKVCEGNLCNSGSILKSGVVGFLLAVTVLRSYI